MSKPCCDKCRHCELNTEGKTDRRWCRVAPPVLLQDAGDWGQWPRVTAGDWCGRFEARQQRCPKCGGSGHIDGHQCDCEAGRSLDQKAPTVAQLEALCERWRHKAQMLMMSEFMGGKARGVDECYGDLRALLRPATPAPEAGRKEE